MNTKAVMNQSVNVVRAKVGEKTYINGSSCGFVFYEKGDDVLCFYESRNDDVDWAGAFADLKACEFGGLEMLA